MEFGMDRDIDIFTTYYVMQWELQVDNYKPEKDT